MSGNKAKGNGKGKGKGKAPGTPIQFWSEFEFGIVERFIAPTLLPREENPATLKIMRIFKEECSFSDQELWIMQIQTAPDGQLLWQDKREILDPEGKATGIFLEVKPKKVIVGITIKELLVKKLQAMQAADPCQINESHLGLWEIFIGPVENEEISALEQAIAARKAMDEFIGQTPESEGMTGAEDDQAAG